MSDAIRPSDAGVLVDVLLQPNAASDEVMGRHGDRIRVRVTAPPRRLAANDAVVELLCTLCGARRGSVVAGRTTRYKTIQLEGVAQDRVEAVLSTRRKARRS